MKIAVITLGCSRNTVDSEKILHFFKSRGFRLTSPNKAETLIINTCGFIEKAKEESIRTIKEALELKKAKKLKKVIVWGCLAKRYGLLLSRYLKDIDAIVGVIRFEDAQRIQLTPTHIGYLKIAQGCSNLCSYCAIPLIQGKLKSRNPASILKEVQLLDRRGVKELNIVAQDITSWAKDIKNAKNLAWLLKKIIKKTKKIQWIRLLYTHPKFISDKLIDVIASNKKICNYIDMPIQHINDRLLKLMNRKIRRKDIERVIKRLRKNIPGIAIRTTFMVGFPTEKDKEFKELLDFVKDFKFKHLGAFLYSKEDGTCAFRLKDVSQKLKKERFDILMRLQQKISLEHNKNLVGKKYDVIIDEAGKNYSIGRAYFQAYEIDSEVIVSKRLKIGSFKKVQISQAYEYDLIGQPIQ